MRPAASAVDAVIFDIGGVVMQSPMLGIRKYERRHGFPDDFINVSIKRAGHSGAWGKFERGEASPAEFAELFQVELADLKRALARDLQGGMR